MLNHVFRGGLFAFGFLDGPIREDPAWKELTDRRVASLYDDLIRIFGQLPGKNVPFNEAQTREDVIHKVLNCLGWEKDDFLPEQRLNPKGREDVPDGLLFTDPDAREQAINRNEPDRRYRLGAAILEYKKLDQPLERRLSLKPAPSEQMLRYMRRADDMTKGQLRWGILSNGKQWRIYYAGARLPEEGFFEVDLEQVLKPDEDLFSLQKDEKFHALRIFCLVFGKAAFLFPKDPQRNFHERALREGSYYEQRVTNTLSGVILDEVFPQLARSINEQAPHAGLGDVRDAALILLYRLLFVLYAEDRNLLPVDDLKYDDYGLRDKLRMDVKKRKDKGDKFSSKACIYWGRLMNLFRLIDEGDVSINLPAYNGGLFQAGRSPLLDEIKLSDAVIASLIDKMSFEIISGERKYINYRDLSVRQLGSIYERLLEYEVVHEGPQADVRLNAFARKGTGSYYTPNELVDLIIEETLEPLIERHRRCFDDKARILAGDSRTDQRTVAERLAELQQFDPATKLLDLRICDPAMGSGHFLVNLVDYLADQALEGMDKAAETAKAVGLGDYVSPLDGRIKDIRERLIANARNAGWRIDDEQLDKRRIIHRMALKKCVYGVDKNPMAVELAKVALWLHGFTVGAPLSFLDHHLRCGDSLFGSWVKEGIDKAEEIQDLFSLKETIDQAKSSATEMQSLAQLPDIEIAEVHRSARMFGDIQTRIRPLDSVLSFLHALEWQELSRKEKSDLLREFLVGSFGNPLEIVCGEAEPRGSGEKLKRFTAILAETLKLARQERFFNWQVAFPGVWRDWEKDGLTGGFDAVIGNPPWERIKLQQVEWFGARKPAIAHARRAADRKRMIDGLETAGDPLAAEYRRALRRTQAMAQVARTSGDYPLLSGGDINGYALFVERAMTLVKPDGMVGLLTPSGIASDKTASKFFKRISTGGRLKALYDFENRRSRFGKAPFFPDVDSRFKFCAFVAGKAPVEQETHCGFFLQDVEELADSERCFHLSAQDFACVNPNTGTAPIFRSRRDAALVTGIYRRLPVLADRSGEQVVRRWPVRYLRMFDMTNDSQLFRTRRELEEEEGAYPVAGNRFKSPGGEWVPLYEGKMIQAYNHRAAGVTQNLANLHSVGQPRPSSSSELADPAFTATPRYWVPRDKVSFPSGSNWAIAFRDITNATNMRTMMAAVVPKAGFSNKLPLLFLEGIVFNLEIIIYLLGCINSLIFDFVSRSKIHGTSVNLYIVEQLPVIPPEKFSQIMFGNQSAAEIIRKAVLELTYTAHDIAPFARDMGYVDEEGQVRPPFRWDDERRLHLCARLDALFFHLYGVTKRDDVRYIYETFPIVKRQERVAYGRYRSRDLCLAYMNALAAGDPDAEVEG